MAPERRKRLAVNVLSQKEPVTDMAEENGVSRKFLYKQAEKADDALTQAFETEEKEKDVLFYIPVTKAWIKGVIVSLVLICHASLRNAVEFFNDVIGYQTSVGTVHSIIKEMVPIARHINEAYDLSPIKASAHDELFQGGKPVLTGIDIDSAFCYLLAREDHRDADTWAIHLSDLAERGLHPDCVAADAGKGLRAGQAAAWSDIPCWGDVFHGLQPLQNLSFFLERRALKSISTREEFEKKMIRAESRTQGQRFSKKLGTVRKEEEQSIYLYDNVKTLTDWMQHDILTPAGPDSEDRKELFKSVTDELQSLEPLCSYRIKPVRRFLENQRDDLLAFADASDEKLQSIADTFHVDPDIVREICKIFGMDESNSRRWQKEAALQNMLKERFYPVRQAVYEATAETPRASSIVENFNGRLRNYFSLRKHLGPDYLELLKFFLNHRKFIRSRKPERAGKTPAEMMTGRKHPHWLEMIGFTAFQSQKI
jgi:hypothetical protein